MRSSGLSLVVLAASALIAAGPLCAASRVAPLGDPVRVPPLVRAPDAAPTDGVGRLRRAARPRGLDRAVPGAPFALRLAALVFGGPVTNLRGVGPWPARDATQVEPESAVTQAQDNSQLGLLEASRLAPMAEDIAVELAELAGLAVVPETAVYVAPRAAIEARARLEVDRAMPPARRALEATVASHLGLLERGADLGEYYWQLLADGAPGVADSADGGLYVAEDISLQHARFLLAHELAQQIGAELDAEADIPSPTTTDERLALGAVREARNMLLVSAWMARHMEADEVQILAADEARRARALGPLPQFVWKPILGLYTQGQAFLSRQARIGPLGGSPRAEDVARASVAPPRSTEELLHPMRYWDAAQVEPATPVRFERGALPEGWSLVHEDTLGELMLALLVTEPDQRRGLSPSPWAIADTRFTNAAADGWDGDRVALLQNGAATYVRLAVRFEGEEDALEFADAVRSVARELELPVEVARVAYWVEVSVAHGVDAAERAALQVALRVIR